MAKSVLTLMKNKMAVVCFLQILGVPPFPPSDVIVYCLRFEER